MRKALLAILLAVFSVFFCISCDNGGAGSAVESYQNRASKAYTVSLELGLPSGSAKSISATPRDILIAISYTKYKATPLFSYNDFGTPQGSTNGQWADFTLSGRYTFAQGAWKIEVEAFASNDAKLYEGSVNIYINSAVGTIEIPLNALVGDGSIAVEVTVPKLSDNGGILTLEYGVFGENPSNPVDLTKTERNGQLVFTTTISNIASGNYVLSFLFGDANLDFHYAETILATVVANMTTSVNGDIPAGQLLVAGQTKELHGDLNRAVCFVCADPASTYVWYVNGVEKQNSSNRVFMFTPESSGIYNIECRLNGSNDNAQIARATLDARTAITITMHMNGSIRQLMTYSGVTSVSDLSSYLSNIYDGNWYTAAENGSGGGGSIYSGADPFTANTTLYAHRKCYTVTFELNGGTLNSGSTTRNVYHGDTVTTVNGSYSALPEMDKTKTVGNGNNRVTYSFRGWFTDENYNVEVTDNTTITGNVTYYAYWLRSSGNNNQKEIFTVTFMTGTMTKGTFLIFIETQKYSQATKIMEIVVEKGKTVPIPELTPQTGKTLDAWYTSYKAGTNGAGIGGSGPSNPYDFSTQITEDKTLYGVWQEGDFTVTFDSNGGTTVGNQGASAGDKLLVPIQPTKDGCIFGGWYTESACTNRWNFETDTVSAARTLYALWYEQKSYIANTTTSGGYIDTGYKPDDNTKIVIDFEYTGNNNTDSVIIGSESPDFKIGTYWRTRLFECHYNGATFRSNGLLYTSGRQTISFQVQNGFVVGNGNYGTPTPGNITSTDTIKIFRSTSVSNTSVGKCYGAQIYSTNDLVRDLVPVIRTSDSKAGLYDQVNDVFYESLGGAFSTN